MRRGESCREHGPASRCCYPPKRPFSTKKHVLLPLAQPSVEVRDPVGAEGDVDAHVLARGHQLVPALEPQPVEHLELEARRGDLLLPRVDQGVLDELLVVGGERGIVAAVEEDPRALLEALADVVHVHPGDALRFLVRPLAEADPVAPPRRFRHVLGGAVQVGLEHDPHVVVALAQRVEDLDRVLGELRAFHVEADEPPHVLGRLQDRGGLLEAEIPGDLLPHRGQLDRDVPVDAFRDQAQQGAGRLRGPPRGRLVEHVLAELVEGGPDPPGRQRPSGADRVLGPFSRDESAGQEGERFHEPPF